MAIDQGIFCQSNKLQQSKNLRSIEFKLFDNLLPTMCRWGGDALISFFYMNLMHITTTNVISHGTTSNLLEFVLPYYEGRGIELRYYHVFIFFILLLIQTWIRKYWDLIPHPGYYKQLVFLRESLSKKILEEEQKGWNLKNSLSKYSKLQKEADILDPRTIEIDFLNVLEKLQMSDFNLFGGPSYRFSFPSPEIIFVFDELDKIGSKLSLEEKIEGGGENKRVVDAERQRTVAVHQLLADMKNLLSSAPSLFIFVGGRNLHDEWLADQTARRPLLTKIFHDEIYLPSLMVDHISSANVGFQTRIGFYVEKQHGKARSVYQRWKTEHIIPSWLLLRHDQEPIRYMERPEFEDRVALNDPRVNKQGIFSQKRSGKDRRQSFQTNNGWGLLKVQDIQNKEVPEWSNAFIDEFYQFLTFRSLGNPKALREFMGDFLEAKNVLLRRMACKDINYECQHMLAFWENDKFRIQLIADFYRQLCDNFEKQMINGDDKLVTAIFYIADFLCKFHIRAFSWSNLERLDEMLHIHRAPNLRKVLEDIVLNWSERYLHPIRNGIYNYRFRSDVSKELQYLSRQSEPELAAFNFTLDESQTLKALYKSKIDSLKDDLSYEFVSALGELHEFDEEYESSRYYYRKAMSSIDSEFNRVFGKGNIMSMTEQEKRSMISDILCGKQESFDTVKQVLTWGVARIRLMLQIGMTYELSRNLERAEVKYRDAQSFANVLIHCSLDLEGQESSPDFNYYCLRCQDNSVLNSNNTGDKPTESEKTKAPKDCSYFCDCKKEKALLSKSRIHVLKDLNVLFQPMFALAWISEKLAGGVDTGPAQLELYSWKLRKTLPFVRDPDITWHEEIPQLRNRNFALIIAEIHNKIGDMHFFKGRQVNIPPYKSIIQLKDDKGHHFLSDILETWSNIDSTKTIKQYLQTINRPEVQKELMVGALEYLEQWFGSLLIGSQNQNLEILYHSSFHEKIYKHVKSLRDDLSKIKVKIQSQNIESIFMSAAKGSFYDVFREATINSEEDLSLFEQWLNGDYSNGFKQILKNNEGFEESEEAKINDSIYEKCREDIKELLGEKKLDLTVFNQLCESKSFINIFCKPGELQVENHINNLLIQYVKDFFNNEKRKSNDKEPVAFSESCDFLKNIFKTEKIRRNSEGYLPMAYTHYIVSLHELRRYNFYRREMSKSRLTPNLFPQVVQDETFPARKWPEFVCTAAAGSLDDLAETLLGRVSLLGLINCINDKNTSSIQTICKPNETSINKQIDEIRKKVQNYLELKSTINIKRDQEDDSFDIYLDHNRYRFNNSNLKDWFGTWTPDLYNLPVQEDRIPALIEFERYNNDSERMLTSIIFSLVSGDLVQRVGYPEEAATTYLQAVQIIEHYVWWRVMLNNIVNIIITDLFYKVLRGYYSDQEIKNILQLKREELIDILKSILISKDPFNKETEDKNKDPWLEEKITKLKGILNINSESIFDGIKKKLRFETVISLEKWQKVFLQQSCSIESEWPFWDCLLEISTYTLKSIDKHFEVIRSKKDSDNYHVGTTIPATIVTTTCSLGLAFLNLIPGKFSCSNRVTERLKHFYKSYDRPAKLYNEVEGISEWSVLQVLETIETWKTKHPEQVKLPLSLNKFKEVINDTVKKTTLPANKGERAMTLLSKESFFLNDMVVLLNKWTNNNFYKVDDFSIAQFKTKKQKLSKIDDTADSFEKLKTHFKPLIDIQRKPDSEVDHILSDSITAALNSMKLKDPKKAHQFDEILIKKLDEQLQHVERKGLKSSERLTLIQSGVHKFGDEIKECFLNYDFVLNTPEKWFRNLLSETLERHSYPLKNRLHGLKVLIDDSVVRQNFHHDIGKEYKANSKKSFSVNVNQKRELQKNWFDYVKNDVDEFLRLEELYDASLQFTPFQTGETLAMFYMKSKHLCEKDRELNSYIFNTNEYRLKALTFLTKSQELYTMRRSYYESIANLYYFYDDFNDRQVHFQTAIQMAGAELSFLLTDCLSKS